MWYFDFMIHRTLKSTDYLAGDEAFLWSRQRLYDLPQRVHHDHDYYELFWVESGCALHTVNGERSELPVGHLVFVRPKDRHAVRGSGPADCQIVNVMFRAASANHLLRRYGSELAGRFFWSSAPLPEVYELSNAQLALLRQIGDELENGARTLSNIEAFLLSVMTVVIRRVPEERAKAPQWLLDAANEMHRPDRLRQGAAGFVAATHRAHAYVCRVTREYLGVTPSEYVNRIRMEHAARLLVGTDDSIVEISGDCGLENQSHFYRLFRQHFGMTPREYRLTYQRDPIQPAR